MPLIARSKTSCASSQSSQSSQSISKQPLQRRNSICTNKSNNTDEEPSTRQAIQINLPLVLPPPFDRQLLSLCFHSSWRTRRHLRIHFSDLSEVLLDDGSEDVDSASDASSIESDPENYHVSLTVVTYDPIAIPVAVQLRTVSSWFLRIAVIVFVTAVSCLAFFVTSIRPYSSSYLSPSLSRSITLRNLTVAIQPYAQFVRLLSQPINPIPAIQREFSELCTTAHALADLDPDLCHRLVELFDTANDPLTKLFVGLCTRGPGNPVSALRDNLILMAWNIEQQKKQQQQQREQHESNAGYGGTWNKTAEGVFSAVTSQVPNWWEDHNALAVPLQTALKSLNEARNLESSLLAAFETAISNTDRNAFPAEDVLYALDRLFDSLLARRDTLIHTLTSATGLLDEAASRMHIFNTTLYAWRGVALAGGQRYVFEGFDMLLRSLGDAVGVLDHNVKAASARQRKLGITLEEEAAREEMTRKQVEEKRPRNRRAREWESEHAREKAQRFWW